jgi:RNA polymerase sigma-70 factor (ECF subfamily)
LSVSDDAVIRQKCGEGDVDQAATLTLEIYGREIMHFLVRRANDDQLASDAFAQFAEDVWRGLSRFEFRCSLKSWVFTLAHHALSRLARERARERRRSVPLFETSHTFALARRMRTDTLPFLRTEVRQGIALLRERLSAEDQLLLELRINQRFSWKDIARITLGEVEQPAPANVDREAARLRKRFELVKKRLRTLAEAEGLLSDL